jgi:hypothetical protein
LGWNRIAALAPEVPSRTEIWLNAWNWIFGSAMVYMVTFRIGKLVLGSRWLGTIFLIIAVVCGYAIRRDYPRDLQAAPSSVKGTDQLTSSR